MGSAGRKDCATASRRLWGGVVEAIDLSKWQMGVTSDAGDYGLFVWNQLECRKNVKFVWLYTEYKTCTNNQKRL